jgi:TPR repeat protein
LALTAGRACPSPATLLTGMLLLNLWTGPASAATSEDGRRAYDAGQFTDAMGIWAELSRQGDAEAEFGLGLLYDLGNGTPANPETAFLWYKMAADAGLPAAEFNVAAMYDAGRGVGRSSENAAQWYAKAGAHGHHRAQFDLGLLYQNGDGVPRNLDAAAAWFRDAADGGLAAAGNRLKEVTAAARTRPAGPMAVVSLVAPERNATITSRGGAVSLELVWVPPAEPQPVHFVVQVRELGSTLRTIFTTSVTDTAVIVPLPANTGFYVWNVNAVGQDGSDAAGDWNWFSVDQATDPTRSMASVPGQASSAH